MKLPAYLAAPLATVLWITAPGAHAHDFWIEASPFRAAAPRTVDISLHVGTDMVGDTQPNIAEWYRDFSYVHAGARREMPGLTGDDPAGRLPARAPGLYLIGYENVPDYAELDAERFQSYLREEGLEWVIAQRRAIGAEEQPAREFYQRCVKSLVRIGTVAPSAAQLQYNFGYRLEMLPQNSPFASERLQVRILFEGKPVEGLLVTAFRKQQPQQRSTARTDAAGLAEVDIAQPGTWLVKTVHMRPYPDDSADWISYWGSLSFARP